MNFRKASFEPTVPTIYQGAVTASVESLRATLEKLCLLIGNLGKFGNSQLLNSSNHRKGGSDLAERRRDPRTSCLIRKSVTLITLLVSFRLISRKKPALIFRVIFDTQSSQISKVQS
jgi:hypothetical protein